MNEKFQRLI